MDWRSWRIGIDLWLLLWLLWLLDGVLLFEYEFGVTFVVVGVHCDEFLSDADDFSEILIESDIIFCKIFSLSDFT